MGYYPDWAAPAFPPEKIDFGRFDWIDFAFAVPDQSYNLTWDGSDAAPDLLERLVTVAHDSGKKVKLSVGGWTGSQYFSPAVSDAASRQTFASNIRAFYDAFDLDGVDIDWEYPGQGGNDGNVVSPDDTSNFLSFLQLLRATLPSDAKMSAAVQTVPFADASGNPLGDVSAFAQVLDWVLIMNYDAWGSSKTPGPNAPLSDACHNSTQPVASAAAAVRAWTSAGFPVNQLVLGVPSYGYISQSTATHLRQRSRPTLRRRSHGRRLRNRHRTRSSLVQWTEADSDSDTAGSPTIMATNDDGSAADGQVQFRGLVLQGILQYAPQEPYEGQPEDTALGGSSAPTRFFANTKEIDSLYDGWSGFMREWDECSSTPFLRSGAAEQVVTYDDPLSLGMKANFAQGVGMLGVNMFDVTGDTDQWDLTDAVRRGLGRD
ncbi:glycoside hydrolase superfamily [Rhodofomes roseus]|uniref:Glycoside hydrolase superfamily n=1 Tax=Rhodofomes roseus TaxID=34475 RepID=A0ABQ8KZG1_9APHY|nr:glycoside hydrolase superfamily [Rhodofomes roseus]KAH9844225.1 glycoside hydrolase superfamily [Rhodofomes roseus]